MTDDIEPNCAGDVGAYPDPSAHNPLEPRSTADFINDVWESRKDPIYALRIKEIEVLQSGTVRGWVWRMALWLLRYSRPTSISVQADLEDTEPTRVFSCGPPAELDNERTMKHYLKVARRWPTLPEEDTEPAKRKPRTSK
jgi:hypothetical protein